MGIIEILCVAVGALIVIVVQLAIKRFAKKPDPLPSREFPRLRLRATGTMTGVRTEEEVSDGEN